MRGLTRSRVGGIARAAIIALAVLSVAIPGSFVQGQDTGDETQPVAIDPGEGTDRAVFSGELDVNLVDLFVSVVNSDRKPVTGLTIDDFEIIEDGVEREITNFQAYERGKLAISAGEDAAEAADPGRYIVLLFDDPSLQRKDYRRLLEPLESFVREGVARNDRFMIARNTGTLEIVKPFTDYGESLIASLRRLADTHSGATALKQNKRYAKLNIHRTDLFQATVRLGTGPVMDVDRAVSRSRLLLSEIEAIRTQEYERIRRALGVVHELLRSLAGVPGRKMVVWVGEDLALMPALDLYNAYYTKTQLVSDLLGLVPPEIWGRDKDLTQEFRAVAASAQAAGASFFVIDASDRDREMATIDWKASNPESVMAAEEGSAVLTAGVNLAEIRALTEGSEFMAFATGGDFFANSRNMDAALDHLEEQVASYYSLAYIRPGDPDGRRHQIEIKVGRPGLTVRHHAAVLNRTEPQRLADRTFSRLRLDIGANPLDLEVFLGEPETADKGRFIQPVRLQIPVGKLVLLPDDDKLVGQILVAVVVIDDQGWTAAPQFVRLSLALPASQVTTGAVAARTIRLMMREGTRRIAVGVRDEVSGIEASQAVAMPGGEQPEGK